MKWIVVHARDSGTSHAHSGQGCQDFHLHKSLFVGEDYEILIAVVADGAGSAGRAREGAELACEYFIEQIATHFEQGSGLDGIDRDFAADCIGCFQRKVKLIAESFETPEREFACTLVCAVVGDESAVFFQLGDGGVVYAPRRAPESYYFGVVPGMKEYANTTDFLTDASAVEKLKFAYLSDPVDKVALFTDGIQPLAISYRDLPEGTPHHPFFAPMFAPLHHENAEGLCEKLEVFLRSDEVNSRIDDDKTLVLVARSGSSSVGTDGPTLAKEEKETVTM